ncbi:MAG: GNAT family N-acetyltransferase [Defluviimonas sp.]|uniref:GNAT family N-acetyltransferase n=1 Tax=Albidovulum sp. TaxID=1872424 RepID=UPI002A2717C5|nr:GNAT family N-acetyltransferase [Defluviimonas sp.]
MDGIRIRPAERRDAPQINAALRALSRTMGDTHAADDRLIERAGFGETPAFHALLAEQAGAVIGAALYSPLLSTTRGATGAHVSDLWVAAALRGQGLGARLLAAVRDRAQAQWGAGFLRLAVYHDNHRAAAFYAGLGFLPASAETTMTLQGAALAAIGEAP